MTTRRTPAVEALFRTRGVATRKELLETGVPAATISRRLLPGGPWQLLLPGVVLPHRGTPTWTERRRGALAFAGPGSAISGLHALELHGLRLAPRVELSPEVVVLVPHTQHTRSCGYVKVLRTTRDPHVVERHGMAVAAIARACVDAVRDGSVDDGREVMGLVVQQRRCTVEQLRDEVVAGPTRGSAVPREVLGDIAAGARSKAEGDVVRLVDGSDLARPVWNQPLVIAGVWVGDPDAYWPTLKVALEIDSMTWHLGAAALRRTQAKQRRYAAAGILLISIAPADLARDPAGFLEILRRTLQAAAERTA